MEFDDCELFGLVMFVLCFDCINKKSLLFLAFLTLGRKLKQLVLSKFQVVPCII